VFAVEDIQLNAELTFDYQWKPSDMLPTKCFCGTNTCRGYLEVFRSDRERALCVGSGQWVSSKERAVLTEQNSDSIFSANGKVIPDRFIGKKVKVWDDDAQAYVEGKVVSYEEDRFAFSVYCLDSCETVDLCPDNQDSTWYWFDDSRSIVFIKKKVG
jgi:hypothetical protein